MPPGSHLAGERGSGTVLTVACAGLVLVLTTAALVLGGVAVATHRARAAADFAALAGATALQQTGGGGDACRRASELATRNAARLDHCAVEPGETVRVRVSTSLRVSWPGLPDRATASARAGPAPPTMDPGLPDD
ncbi:Rv3654c family TadE-like protein [Knoellia remsis]|uniref:Rv3654c family TadE-like protein n=1 Tax=Knoellia remsis TaxID=407159 RepID=UPI000D07546E|nr:Rv3654c family TadE-like protein [Knoellia remsis]